MLEIIAGIVKLIDKALDKVPPAEKADALRILELELAKRRVVAKAQARLDQRRARIR